MALHLDRRIIIVVASIVAAGFMILPFMMKTRTYPIAIIEGNSMYPNLQNGDLVVFHTVPPQEIVNGTIIVFVQGETGMSMLDSLIKPVVIHRVVDIIVQADGVINYRTKGDNNQDGDPQLVKGMEVLGTPNVIVPKLGILLLFIRSAQGMIAIIGFITLLYLGYYETKIKEDKKRSDFLGAIGQMVLKGELSEDLFRNIEIAVKYADDIKIDEINDGYVTAVINWVNNGGLDHKWKVEKVECPKCGLMATKLDDGKDQVTICMKCEKEAQQYMRNMGITDKIYDEYVSDNVRLTS